MDWPFEATVTVLLPTSVMTPVVAGPEPVLAHATVTRRTRRERAMTLRFIWLILLCVVTHHAQKGLGWTATKKQTDCDDRQRYSTLVMLVLQLRLRRGQARDRHAV